ncbi:MAG: GNAT family N-acetyltransferase [Burkholderiaceae bacterium]
MTRLDPSDHAYQFVYTTPDDPLAEPLTAGLREEYATRYRDLLAQRTGPDEMEKYAPELFAPAAGGNFVLLLDHGEVIAGGAFKRHPDPGTAEIKRMWTHPGRRRQGLAVRVMHELEAQAARQGYQRLYLTTGSRQPEAIELYLSLGFTALEDLAAVTTVRIGLPFVKQLAPRDTAPSKPT